MPNLRGSEWLIIILLVVLLFGAKRLPDAARSIGRSLRIFKAETKGLTEDSTPPTAAPASTASTAPAAPAGPAPATPAAELPAASAPAGDDAISSLQPQADQAPGALQPQPPTQA
jgi:sec-independent protein translocase protein TatA